MKDKVSAAQLRRQKGELLKLAVIALFKWTEEGYAWFQYREGLHYLNKYIQNAEVLERSPMFWAWWRNHWISRDEEFIEFVKFIGDASLNTKRKHYVARNNGRWLASEVHPNRIVLDESYSDMIYEMVKEEVKKPRVPLNSGRFEY